MLRTGDSALMHIVLALILAVRDADTCRAAADLIARIASDLKVCPTFSVPGHAFAHLAPPTPPGL